MKTKNLPTKEKYIIYLGSSRFPYGFAETQKIILISQSLIHANNSVTVVCNKGVYSPKDHPELKETGNYNGIEYVFTSGNPFTPEKFIKRNLLKIKGIYKECQFVKNRSKNNQLDCAIISTHSFYSVVYCYLLSRIYGFKTILNYVEFYSKVKKEWYQFKYIINDILYDRFAPSFSDGVLPISEFLIDHLKKVAPSKKYLKLPGLTDFDRYNDTDLIQGEKYFLFCGNVSYMEIIEFILDSYNKLTNTSVFLYLVISGNHEKINELKNRISLMPSAERIKIFSHLTERELFTNYRNAIALLIPLRPTFQDIARFPHKTGEYLASGNPVISTNYGEVKYYFKDKQNMLLAESYDIDLFAEKMQFAIDNPELIKEIGINGKTIASQLFDYKVKAKDLNQFFDEVIN